MSILFACTGLVLSEVEGSLTCTWLILTLPRLGSRYSIVVDGLKGLEFTHDRLPYSCDFPILAHGVQAFISCPRRNEREKNL